MTPGRGDRTAPPAPDGHWEVRFADAASAKGWENLAQQARENTYRAWLTLRTHPKPAMETPRHHRLKGGLAHGTHRGRTCEQWQIEVLVTVGVPEAIAAAMSALLEPDDEVIAFESFYDPYTVCNRDGRREARTAHPSCLLLPLGPGRTAPPRSPQWTRLLLLNTPSATQSEWSSPPKSRAPSPH